MVNLIGMTPGGTPQLLSENPRVHMLSGRPGNLLAPELWAKVFAEEAGEIEPAPPVFLAPYLPLGKTLDIGRWFLVPFDEWHPHYAKDPGVFDVVARLADAYDPGVYPYAFGVVCVPSDRWVGDEINPELQRPLSRTLLAAALDAIPRLDEHDLWCAECRRHQMTTTENCLVFALPLDTSMVQTKTGSSVVRTLTQIRESPEVVTPPEALYLPDSAMDLDPAFAGGLFEMLSMSDPLSRQLDVSIAWVGLAASNATMMTPELRVIALRTAFEVLTGASKTRRIRDAIQALIGPGVDEERKPRTWMEQGRERSEWLTNTEWWFQQFSVLRNALVHGGPVHDDDWKFEGMSHATLAQEVLLECLRRLVFGHNRPDRINPS